ncbi:CbaC protein [Natrarchaeobaculum aegyptiacum]|uniref:CbaC protein n=1 Tax=Natrarchaeobaculum aegyptiacum TaxID=745377 RepID=A0A2Z2HYV5_9EURY|nr:CbaC protein [Natrarchaeobaculum aegyptiacum]ARS91037.1 CbaC protein [Natrarchaeobaculum aegyptiacum]
MRTSPARLLIVLAFLFVIVLELRTVLAFFDVYVTVLESVVAGAVATLAILVWAFWPTTNEDDPA